MFFSQISSKIDFYRPKSEILILNQVLQGTRSMEHQLKDLQYDVGEIYTNNYFEIDLNFDWL